MEKSRIVPTIILMVVLAVLAFYLKGHFLSDAEQHDSSAKMDHPHDSEGLASENKSRTRAISRAADAVGTDDLSGAREAQRLAHQMMASGLTIGKMFDHVDELGNGRASFVHALNDFANRGCMISGLIDGSLRAHLSAERQRELEPIGMLEFVQTAFVDGNKRWALEKLQDLCADLDAVSFELLTLSSEYLPYDVGVVHAIRKDIDDGNYGSALNEALSGLRQSRALDSLSTFSTTISDIHYESMFVGEEIDLIDHRGISAEEARTAADNAAVIFHCERNGGCGMNNPITLSYCVRFGCDQEVHDLADLFDAIHSPREIEVINQYLRLLRSEVRPGSS